MVLIDTSVWIRFLRNRPPFAESLDRLLGRGEVAGHNLVYGELLIGDPGGRAELLRSYKMMQRLPDVSHEEVIAFVSANRLQGRGVGWVDTHLLASCLVADVPIWTADQSLACLAAELGVQYS